MLKKTLSIMNSQNVRSDLPSLLMGPAVLWESFGDGRRLYGVPYDKLQKLLAT